MPVRRVLLNDCKYLKRRDIDLFSVFVWRVKDLTGMAGACVYDTDFLARRVYYVLLRR